MKRIFKNKSGNILVRVSKGNIGACGIVEILHLWHENKSGCVIAAYEVRDVDGQPMAELKEVHDRLTSADVEPDRLYAALVYGRKLADLLVESDL